MGPKTWKQFILRWLFAITVLIAVLFILSVIARDIHHAPAMMHAMLFGGSRIHGMLP